jgi:hypothetical protein
MPLRPSFLALFAALLAGAAAFAKPAPHGPPDLTGLWVLTTGEVSIVHAADVSLTPYGKARMEAREAEIRKGLTRSEGHVRCEPAGMPQMMTAPFGIQIMQNSDRIVLNAEVSNLPRTIYFRAAHPAPDDLDPSWNGNSIGRWEGPSAHKTLVVDTIGFNDVDAFDFNFDPPVKRTPSLHLTERLHLEKGGTRLVDDMTLDDPKTFTTPAHVSYVYRRLPKEAGLMEYVCEPDIPAIQAYDAEHPGQKAAYSHPY